MVQKISRNPRTILFFSALLLFPAVFLTMECFCNPDIPFIFSHSKADWIMYPYVLELRGRIGGITDPDHFFKEFFVDEEIPEDVLLHIQALRFCQVYINGVQLPIESSRGKNWKQEINIPLSGFLKKGANTIRADVSNPLGPALLYLYVEGLKVAIATDKNWMVSFGSTPYVQAILADDTRLYPKSLVVPTPWHILMKNGKMLLLLFISSTILLGAGHFLFPGHLKATLPRVALLGITVFWIYLFFSKMRQIDAGIGFDAECHIDYIRYILKHRTIPLATEGWSMFHPPLFYLLSAGLLEVFRPLFSLVGPFSIVKVFPFLCGLGNVWVAFFIGRKIFRDDPVMTFWVVFSAGMIPMNIYMSAYIGNEPLLALLVSLSFLVIVQILRNPAAPFRKFILLGILLGLALLTKITALVVILVAGGFLALKLIFLDRLGVKKAAYRIAWVYSVIAIVAGWYFLRNFIYLGHFYVINWNLPMQLWWQDPGFHSIRYYLGFGEALRHPFFSGFHSFGDAIYSTFWGDAYNGGEGSFEIKYIIWNFKYMSIVYLLALPASLFFVLGLLRSVWMVIRGKTLETKITLAISTLLLYTIGLMVLYSTLKVPIYGQAKAFYCLSAIAPISIIFALGLGMVNDWLASSRLRVVRAVFYGWFGTLVSMIYLSFGA
jgi:hypothetical protein